MTTGQRIKAARKNAGLTQKELGQKLGVAYQTLAQWENDLRNPKPETLRRIANALDMYYLDLYGDDEADLVKTGVDLGKSTAQTTSNILTRMEIVAEFQEQGYTFEIKERRLVRAFSKITDDGKAQILQLTEGMAELPRFMLEPPQSPPAPSVDTDTPFAQDAPEGPKKGAEMEL